MPSQMEKLARASMGYTVIGLAGGVYYRELTRHLGFDRSFPTQLRAFHSHCFSLGTIFLLVVLILEKQFKLSQQKNYKKFYATYSMGVGITMMMMLIHGTLTVLGKDEQTSRLITWSAGFGHVMTTIGFGYFFNVLKGAIKADEDKTN